MTQRLRIFISSPSDVRAAREVAAHTIERVAQDYARFFDIQPYLWESEPMLASAHFQDSIDPPSSFDLVVLILESRLGTPLPERTAVREYRGIDGRAPVTGTEWEFEDALAATRERGVPDLLVYRSKKDAQVSTWDAQRRHLALAQLEALDVFWSRHFADQNSFIAGYATFANLEKFAARFQQDLRRCIERRIAGLHPAERVGSWRQWAEAPFRGLESYEFEHAPIYFGQDEPLAKTMLQLTGNAELGTPFLLILGASGSGKSSLVKAGVLPKLFVQRRVPGSAFLRRVIFCPSEARDGEDLFDAFARRLVTQISDAEGLSELLGPGQTIAALAAHFRNATTEPAYPIGNALGQLAVQARQGGTMLTYETAKLVLVIDQLEEIFTNDSLAPDERRKFIGLLAGLMRSGLVWVIATMRKDFWHRADETPDLVRLAEGAGRVELLPPSLAQLSEIIRRPAEAAGVSWESHANTNVPLNEQIAEEVAREAGALPLLSYLLDQLYRSDVLEAGGSTLTYGAYEKLGRLSGAIATKAESVLARCTPEERQALGSVLYLLIQFGMAGGEVDRAVARRVSLDAFPLNTPRRKLVDALLDPDARLLVIDEDQGSNPTVRVAHEALISGWALAREYVQNNGAALKIRRRIEERFSIWSALQVTDDRMKDSERAAFSLGARWRSAWNSRFGPEHGLLSDVDLIDGRQLLREHRSNTDAALISYIERSHTTDKRRRTRAVRLLSAVAATVTLFAIIATAAGLIASRKQREAEHQEAEATKAQSRLLTEAAAHHLKDSDLTAAQGIILEVLTNPQFGNVHSTEAISVFQEIRALDPQIAVIPAHQAAIYRAVFSHNDQRIVTASADQTARIWDARSGTLLLTLSGHGGGVRSAVFSNDDTRILTVSKDKNARVWDVRNGALLVTLPARGAALSSEGSRIVTVTDDAVRIWNSHDGALLTTLSGHAGGVYDTEYSGDDKRIVVVSTDRTATIWDAQSGHSIATLSLKNASINAAKFSPDGTLILTLSSDNCARIWDGMNGELVAVLSGHTDVIRASAFSPDSKNVVTTSQDSSVRIWDAQSGASLAVMAGHRGWVISAAYSPDGKRIVTSASDQTARVWDSRTGASLATLMGHRDHVLSAVYSFDGTRILTASEDGLVRLWNANAGAPTAMIVGQAGFNSATFSPDGTRILAASEDKTARIWNAQTLEQVLVLAGHTEMVSGAFYSRAGDQIVTSSRDQTAVIWNAYTGEPLKTFFTPDADLDAAAYSPDGMRLVTTAHDNNARIWSVDTTAILHVLSGHRDRVNDAHYSPDGLHIVTTSFDKTARIWHAVSGAQLLVLSGHNATVVSATYSPDGSRIGTASADETARIWDAETGSALVTLSGHRGGVDDINYSVRGDRIVTASDDGTARIWDARSGEQLAALIGHRNTVTSAAFSPDGNSIITASADKTLRLWKSVVSAPLRSQILWYKASEFDPLSDIERTHLGLHANSDSRTWPATAGQCDLKAGAYYDPDRLAPGMEQSLIVSGIADVACSKDRLTTRETARWLYEEGRALLANNRIPDAKRIFELAISHGYRSAQVDLADLLLSESSATAAISKRALSLYEQAWRDGVSIAAFKLGEFYAHGLAHQSRSSLVDDQTAAGSWYKLGVDVGEPNALARTAERAETAAVAEVDPKKKDALFLLAFESYAGSARKANDEGWPDETWRKWRYRQATLARALGSEGMIDQVVAAYQRIRR